MDSLFSSLALQDGALWGDPDKGREWGELPLCALPHKWISLELWPKPTCSRENVGDVGKVWGFCGFFWVFFGERKEVLVSVDHGTLGLPSTRILDMPCSCK